MQPGKQGLGGLDRRRRESEVGGDAAGARRGCRDTVRSRGRGRRAAGRPRRRPRPRGRGARSRPATPRSRSWSSVTDPPSADRSRTRSELAHRRHGPRVFTVPSGMPIARRSAPGSCRRSTPSRAPVVVRAGACRAPREPRSGDRPGRQRRSRPPQGLRRPPARGSTPALASLGSASSRRTVSTARWCTSERKNVRNVPRAGSKASGARHRAMKASCTTSCASTCWPVTR